MKSLLICTVFFGFASVFAMPFDKESLPRSAEFQLSKSLLDMEFNVSDVDALIKDLLKGSVTFLEDANKDIVETLKKNLTETETKVYHSFQDLVKTAINDFQVARKEFEDVEVEKNAIIIFIQKHVPKLRRLRNGMWELLKTSGLTESDQKDLDQFRQMARAAVSCARLMVLVLQDRVEVTSSKLMELFKVSSYPYMGMRSAIGFFQNYLDQEDDFFKRHLSDVQVKVYKAFFGLFRQGLKDTVQAMLEWEDAEYDKNLMAPVLRRGLKKIEKLHRDVEELARTEGLDKRDYDLFNDFITRYIKVAEEMVSGFIRLIEAL